MARLGVGVIGLGIGRHHVAANAQAAQVGRLVLCHVDPGRRTEVQDAFGPDATQTGLTAMQAEEALGAIAIARARSRLQVPRQQLIAVTPRARHA